MKYLSFLEYQSTTFFKDIEAEKITPVVTETAPPETANNNFRELLDVLREKDSTISRNGRGNRDAQTDNYTT